MSRLLIGILMLLLAGLPGQTFAAPGKEADAGKATDEADAGQARRARSDRSKPGSREANGDALPSQNDVRRTFDRGDYNGTLQKLARVVGLKGEAAAGYDKYALWMLKGESHLRLKQIKQANDAFGMAARETDDDVEGATARALQRLLGESKAFQVKRRFPRRGEKVHTADVLDPDQRDQALRILYEDAQVEAQPKVKAALKARTLPPIAEALELATGGRDLELAVAGADGELADARAGLTQRAKQLIDRELSEMREKVEAIREDANKTLERRAYRGSRSGRGGGSYQRIIKRGLTDKDRRDLAEIIEQCRKIIPTVDSLAEATEGTATDFDKLIKATKEVGNLADRTLNDRYRLDD